MDTGLAGKRVLVTGASGGIGSACARAFAAEGAAVVAHSHRGRERAEALGDVKVVGADLTREDEVDRLFSEAGPLDVCAAVAGAWPSDDVPVWELPLERWRATLEANLTTTFLTARGFLRQLEGDRAPVVVGSDPGLVRRRITPKVGRRSDCRQSLALESRRASAAASSGLRASSTSVNRERVMDEVPLRRDSEKAYRVRPRCGGGNLGRSPSKETQEGPGGGPSCVIRGR